MTLDDIKQELIMGNEVMLYDYDLGWVIFSEFDQIVQLKLIKDMEKSDKGRAQLILLCHECGLMPSSFTPGAAYAVAKPKHRISPKQRQAVHNIYNNFGVARKMVGHVLSTDFRIAIEPEYTY